jgi:hypothetical protein
VRHAIWALEALLVFALVFGGVSTVLDALGQLTQVRTLVQAGLQDVEAARSLVPQGDKLDAALEPTTLLQIRADLTGAERNFAMLRRELANPQRSFALASHLPWSGSVLASAGNLAAAADEACLAGLAVVDGAQLGLQVLRGGFFADDSSPSGAATTLDMPTYSRLRAGLTTALQHLRAAIAFASRADLSVLPASLVKPRYVAEIRQLLARRAEMLALVSTLNAALDALPSIAGIASPTTYLVELMDSTEMRPSGGFIGNYTTLTLANAKIQPFIITDTYLLDSPYLVRQGGVVPVPSQYAWWPWASSYGLRDSNLSGDFPTSASTGIQQLAREGGPTVAGVIAVTPAAIEGVLHIVGPIAMPQYGQVVTDTNLEHLIHLYELVPSEWKNAPVPPGEQISSPEKRFTALLGKALLQKLHGLSLATEIAIGKQVLASVHTKDVQLYFTDPDAEALLRQYQADGALPHASNDGVSIVDANVTANKGSQFVAISLSDHVELDTQGTATHDLAITYTFDVTNPTELYGPDYYLTYLRVYAPGGAQLISLQGFTNLDGADQIDHSDQSGYQMWGGFVRLEDQQSYTLRISWRVPHAAVRQVGGRFAYTCEYTRQPALRETLDTTVHAPGSGRSDHSSKGTFEGDQYLSLTYSS